MSSGDILEFAHTNWRFASTPLIPRLWPKSSQWNGPSLTHFHPGISLWDKISKRQIHITMYDLNKPRQQNRISPWRTFRHLCGRIWWRSRSWTGSWGSGQISRRAGKVVRGTAVCDRKTRYWSISIIFAANLKEIQENIPHYTVEPRFNKSSI